MRSTVHPSTEKILAAIKSRFAELKLRALRDAFAAASLPGLLASSRYAATDDHRIARDAYALADALIAARGGKDT